MNNEDFEMNSGWRPVFQYIPTNKSLAQSIVMPLGTFYSPFLTQVESMKKGKFPSCVKCKAAVNEFCRKDRQMGKWICNFCGADNALLQGFGN